MLPDPELEFHGKVWVVRDDRLPGGTKRRAAPVLFDDHEEYVYASPAYGYAQLALAHAAQDHGKRATICVAKRQHRHPLTIAAEWAGARILEVPHGYLTVVTARARTYALENGAKLLPFGFHNPAFIEALAAIAKKIPYSPREVWCVAGSGTLSTALQLAWPYARHCTVVVGANPRIFSGEKFIAPEKYEQEARFKPPFPSCTNYDAKAWRFIQQHATEGALFWNVGS